MDTTTAVLIAARTRIADPERWTQGTTAERHDGPVVALCHPLEADADAWCAVGALERAAGSRRNPAFADGYYRLERALQERWTEDDPAVFTSGVEDYNDSHDHADVLALFDAAIRAK